MSHACTESQSAQHQQDLPLRAESISFCQSCLAVCLLAYLQLTMQGSAVIMRLCQATHCHVPVWPSI